MPKKKYSNYKEVFDYAKDVRDGKIKVNKYRKLGVERFFRDLENPEYIFDPKDAEFVIQIAESTLCHQQGEAIDGTPLRGKPFLFQPFQKFIIYNLFGFKHKDTKIMRFHEALIYQPRKNGKALSLDTEIPTPDGWKLMKDIHVGDYVFGADGKPSKVLVESEIFDKPMYMVTFEDKAQVKASADHIWTVTCKDIESRKWSDFTTEYLSKHFKRIRLDGKGTEYRYRVPMNKPVEYPEKELPIHPYVFGLWLGDGRKDDTSITCCNEDKDEIMSYIVECGHTVKWHEHKDRAGEIGIDKNPRGGIAGTQGMRQNKTRNHLRELGVFNNKHIPEIYMQSSVEQRKELLKGLMDTDGTVSKRGQCSFSQKDENLIKQVKELCASLGIKANYRRKEVSCNGKKCEAFDLTFFVDKENSCFKLQRKSEKLKEKLNKRMEAKSIIDIQPIPNEPSKCIMIDNDTHLYLCGRNYTATHNTGMAAALAYGMALLYKDSGSKVYLVAGALKQSLEAFGFLDYNIKRMGEWEKDGGNFKIIDNNNEHSIKANFKNGSMFIQALASNPDAQDSLNCSASICDELHCFKTPKQYNLFKEAMKAYSNKLLIGISSAGDNENSFLGKRLEYCKKVLDGTIEDEQYFIFLAEADADESGEIDYTNPEVHQMANPNYGITIRPQEILNDSLQAQNDPQQRKDFFAKSLNVYTTSMKSYFDIEEFRASDKEYNWTIEQLSKLPIKWYGGADLSRLHDLTAAALFGQYNDVDIVITHAFFPIVQAANKQDEDGIPLFGWADKGWLTMSNSPTVNMGDIVNWFVKMRDMGFKIVQVGHDRKFAGEEYIPLMKQQKFNVVDQPQLFYLKSQGFRHLERSAKNKKLYYLHSEAYEYCVSNVRAIEKTDDAVAYEKVNPTQRIDLFDASVFACIRCVQDQDKQKKVGGWFG